MATAYIVDAVRTAGGRRGGRLAGVHPVDLAAQTLDALVERTGIDPTGVDDVVMGCGAGSGDHSMDIARMAALDADKYLERIDSPGG